MNYVVRGDLAVIYDYHFAEMRQSAVGASGRYFDGILLDRADLKRVDCVHQGGYCYQAQEKHSNESHCGLFHLYLLFSRYSSYIADRSAGVMSSRLSCLKK